ncbi:c-type cytochrome [Janthinobacterium sp. PSPC3-1]|uniref:c-type cytochrome n=1 Tax=Janthinobacterium sp. PSPC3-1 TaxID=2804653 RepID=UPI003CF22DEC
MSELNWLLFRIRANLSRGAALYKAQCASCHGAAGAGDGSLARQLEPKPIAFTDRERARSRSLMALHQVISQGVADTSMQAFASLSDADRWSLAFYVGTLGFNDTDIKAGKEAFARDTALGKALPDMSALVTVTEEELAKAMPPNTARAALAYARTHPEMVILCFPSIDAERDGNCSDLDDSPRLITSSCACQKAITSCRTSRLSDRSGTARLI